MSTPAQADAEQPEPVLRVRCLRYPALFDEESGVRFDLAESVEVTVAQAELLAARPFLDRIVIGQVDEDGRIVNEQPVKDWAKARRVAAGEGDANEDAGSGPGEKNTPDEATTVAPKKKTRST